MKQVEETYLDEVPCCGTSPGADCPNLQLFTVYIPGIPSL
jgi:hypothetical protein